MKVRRTRLPPSHPGQTGQGRNLSVDELSGQVQALPVGQPRILASGNHGVPWQLLEVADKSLERYRLFMLNAPTGLPDRDGVTLETPFVGIGMRGKRELAYYPSRLSLVPALLKERT